MRRKKSKRSKFERFTDWFDIAEFFYLIGRGFIWLFRALFRFFD